MGIFVSEALELKEFSRELRRDFHRHPELGFQEVRTAGIVSQELKKLGLEVRSGVARTGVVGLWEGGKPGPVMLVRFDMDALPIQEESGAEYASQKPGVMHACGHDGHTAIGLTVAHLLSRRQKDLSGSVKFVFQPAEEGLGGAEGMIAEGVLAHPEPDYAFALHLWNEKPVGWFGVTPGPLMAASEVFQIRLIGKGGHGALPHLAIDPITGASQIVSALQTIASRNVSPLRSVAISVTSIHAGETFNVIPQWVELKGTIRTFDSQVRQYVLRRFQEIVAGVGQAMGCQVEINLQMLTPAVVNDAQVAKRVSEVGRRLFPDAAFDDTFQTMVSEDMAYMMQDIPGCYFLVGSANFEKGLDAPHHHPRFDIDEEALPMAAALMSAVIANHLQ